MVGEHMWVKVVYVSTPVRPGEAFCVCCVSKVVAARCEGYNCMLLMVRRRIPNHQCLPFLFSDFLLKIHLYIHEQKHIVYCLLKLFFHCLCALGIGAHRSF